MKAARRVSTPSGSRVASFLAYFYGPLTFPPPKGDSVRNQRGMKHVEAIQSQDSLWLLRCKNQKCLAFFDYFGRLRPTSINCTHCGKRYPYDVRDFERHRSEE
jgi:hypothetical protein